MESCSFRWIKPQKQVCSGLAWCMVPVCIIPLVYERCVCVLQRHVVCVRAWALGCTYGTGPVVIWGRAAFSVGVVQLFLGAPVERRLDVGCQAQGQDDVLQRLVIRSAVAMAGDGENKMGGREGGREGRRYRE